MAERIVTWITTTPWPEYVGQMALAILGAWLVKKFLMGRLKRWLKKAERSWYDEVVGVLDQALTPSE